MFSLRLSSRPNASIDESLLLKIEEMLKEHVCIELVELANQIGADLETLKRTVKSLERQDKLRIIAREFVSSSSSIEHAHEVLAQIWREKHQISPSEFKERLNITRKYAMPLLSFFDDELITRRVGNGRVLLKSMSSRKE